MFDLKTSILDDEDGGELDWERVEVYINSLMAEFAESPEGKAVMEEFDDELGWAATFMELAATYFVSTPATITPGETSELIFEIFPRKVSVQPQGAYQIVAELRAFWKFLDRTRSVESAGEILALLANDAAEYLKDGLDDPDSYGLAKMIVMSALDAGVDISDPQEVNRFMSQLNTANLARLTMERVDAMGLNLPKQEPDDTIVREFPRVGRNDPCPCGSGRKYKKCCMR